MNKLLLWFVCAISCFYCHAQSAGNRYVSRMTQDGTLFFINPQKLNDLSGIKKFEYDMTMLSWTDSITVNFTFESDKMTLPSEVMLRSGTKTYECNNYSSLFIDIKKNHFEIRITSKFLNKDIEEIISRTDPLSFVIKQDGVTETASYNPKKWRKESKMLTDIYKLYLYSK